jgi:hypothetical protein
MLTDMFKSFLFLWGKNTGLENRDYGRMGSAALTMRHPSIRKRWQKLRRQAALARSV